MKLPDPVETNITERAKLTWIKHKQGKVKATCNLKRIKVDQFCRKIQQELANAEEEFKATGQYIFHRNYYLLGKSPMELTREQCMRESY